MSIYTPYNITVNDICIAALKESGAFGVGQTPLADDITDAWARLQFMLQEWNRKRFLMYHLITKVIPSTGAMTYSIGAGGDIDTGPNTMRPDKLENGNFLRQTQLAAPNQVDYPLELLQSMEDYNRISLKSLQSFPGKIFYDPTHPLGTIYVWPVPQPAIYSLGIIYKEQLPSSFTSLATVLNLPFEYFNAILYNLALRLRPRYGMITQAGDMLPSMARDALNTVRGANTAISRLRVPQDLQRPGLYNIFSDRTY